MQPTRSRRRLSDALVWLVTLTWLAALVVGGGPGWRGERLLVVPALVFAVHALRRVVAAPRESLALRRLCWPPLLVLFIPLLQLVPLPWSVWSQLPGRAALAADLASAGAAGGWRAFTLAPFQTESAFESLLVPCGLYMAAVCLDGDQRRRLLRIGMMVAAVNVFVGLLQLAQGPASALYFHTNTNHDDAVGLFANRNHLAIFLASLVPVSLGALMDRLRHVRGPARDLRVWGLTSLLVVLAIGATATRSRLGFAMLVVGLLTGTLVALRARRAFSGSRIAVWIPLGALLALAVVLQFTLMAFLQRVQADQAEDLRWQLGREAIHLAAPAAGLGYGIGSFPQVYNLLGDAAAQTYAYVNHVHDDYLELWLEGGVPALLPVAAALYWLLRQLLRLWAEQSGSDATSTGATRDPHRALKLGAAVALLMLALHSAFDYPLRTLALQCYAALLVALVVGSVRPGRAVSG